MRILVTGGTGFIGGHTLRALVDAGHTPRALVRSVDKLREVERLHGLPTIDHVVGDITDAAAVNAALQGCDSCLHAAAITAFKRADADAVAEVNAVGGRTVLQAAVDHGCDPVIHVSTVSAIFPPRGAVLTPDDPVTRPTGGYSRSKAEIDAFARERQAAGAPIVIVYPGGVVGPTDAGLNILADGMSRMINAGVLAFPQRGGNIWIDVRDFAAVLAKLVQPNRGPRRYMAGGRFVEWTDFIALIESLASGEFDVQRPSNEDLIAYAKMAEEQAAESGADPAIDLEAAEYMCEAVPSDDSRLVDEFGVQWRASEESWRDMLSWCAQKGLLAPERTQKLLGTTGTQR